jgi:hypothetical protein
MTRETIYTCLATTVKSIPAKTYNNAEAKKVFD